MAFKRTPRRRSASRDVVDFQKRKFKKLSSARKLPARAEIGGARRRDGCFRSRIRGGGAGAPASPKARRRAAAGDRAVPVGDAVRRSVVPGGASRRHALSARAPLGHERGHASEPGRLEAGRARARERRAETRRRDDRRETSRKNHLHQAGVRALGPGRAGGRTRRGRVFGVAVVRRQKRGQKRRRHYGHYERSFSDERAAVLSSVVRRRTTKP